jgi:predicted acetyltransferase
MLNTTAIESQRFFLIIRFDATNVGRCASRQTFHLNKNVMTIIALPNGVTKYPADSRILNPEVVGDFLLSFNYSGV